MSSNNVASAPHDAAEIRPHSGRAAFWEVWCTNKVEQESWQRYLDVWGATWVGYEQSRPDYWGISTYFVYSHFAVFPSAVKWADLRAKLLEIVGGQELELHIKFEKIELWDDSQGSSPKTASEFYHERSEWFRTVGPNQGCVFGDAAKVFAACSAIDNGNIVQYEDYELFGGNWTPLFVENSLDWDESPGEHIEQPASKPAKVDIGLPGDMFIVNLPPAALHADIDNTVDLVGGF